MRTPIRSFALSASLCLLFSLFVCLAVAQGDDPVALADSAADASPKPNPNPKLDLTPDAKGGLSEHQMQELFRVVASKDEENEKRLRDYTYIERDEQHNLDGKGNVKSTEAKTYEVMELYSEQVQRLIEKDDKPLPEKDKAKEEEKVQKLIDKRKNVREIADAYNFKLVGTELIGGREAWVIDGEPRPGYEPHMKEAKFLPKFHGRVWIDKDDLQLSKLDVECLDTVSWGLFLARFHKGSRFQLEQTRVNDEVWLPRQLTVKIDVRLALLKNFNVDVEQTFRDYKKFRATTKIVGVGEITH